MRLKRARPFPFLLGLSSLAAAPARAIIDGQGVADSHPLARSIVGVKTQRLSHPFDVTYCSGVLVSPTQILTAAHCVQGAWLVKVKFADDSDASFFSARLARGWKLHPGYEPDGELAGTHDVALVRLSRAAPWGYVPATLGWSEPTPPGTVITATGYGSERFVTLGAKDLGRRKRALMRVFVTEELSANWPSALFAEMDAQLGPDAGSTAEGDSGGGAFVQTSEGYALVGLNVAGNPQRASMFESLAALRDWLEPELRRAR